MTLEQKTLDTEVEKKYNYGDYSINPQGSNRLLTKVNKNERGEIKSVEFNKGLTLGGISKISVLDDYSKYTASWYQIERIVSNSIKEGQISEEVALNLLEWNKDEGRHRKNSTSYEDYIIKALAENELVSDKIIDWLMERRRSDFTMLELVDRKILNPEQVKKFAIESSSPFAKLKLIEKGLVNVKTFTAEEIEKVYLNASKDELNTLGLYDEIATRILPSLDPKEREAFVQKAIGEVLSLFEECEAKNQKEGGNAYPSSYCDIVRSITRHPRFLTDEQIISLIEKIPFTGIYDASDRLPGWAFRGMALKYGTKYNNFEHHAIRDFNNPVYKEKYALMEEMFSKDPPIAEILTEKEKGEIIEEVQLYGLKLFRPIYPAGKEEKDAVMLEHISGKPGLKYLTPRRARQTTRSLGEYAVFLQRGNYDTWQIDHLREVNKGDLYSYQIRLSRGLFQGNVFYQDDRWEGGYSTRRPIILDPKLELTWEMFNPIMKARTLYEYEERWGKLPEEIKKELMAGGDIEDYSA